MTWDKHSVERKKVRAIFGNDLEKIKAWYLKKYPNCDEPRHPGCEKCKKGKNRAERN